MKKTKNAPKKESAVSEFFRVYPVTVVSLAVSLLMCGVTFFFDYRIAAAELCVVAVIVIVALAKRGMELKKLHSMIKMLEKNHSSDDSDTLKNFPLPVVIFDSLEKVIWYNNLFRRNFLFEKPKAGVDLKQFTSGQGLDIIHEKNSIECEFAGKLYTAYCSRINYKNDTVYALYYVDDTQLKKYRAEYQRTRPIAMLISIDGVEDRLRDFRESQVAEVFGGVEPIIENWFNRFNCIVRKIGSGRFMVISEVADIINMKKDKFSILSQIRSYTYNEKALGLSLSIGAGMGTTLPECEKSARQALDMALGRGGDQVAIKNEKGEYEFFGGVSKGVETRNKVRTRIVAAAITETIKSSSNVLIMGHRFTDLDSLGSAVGVAMICRSLGKEAKIVMSSENTLAKPLAEHLISNGIGDIFVEPEDSERLTDGNTLLVVVDTHRKSFLEYPTLFDHVNSVVVIDHHRKTVDHINQAVIFYHEPFASSASEMVTELIQYMSNDVTVPKACAEALLAGITLDTKNFVMKTGVRTFEAAAYLRSLGADTVAVKQLFANSMNTQKAKSEVVKNASMYKNCAVGVVDFKTDDIRIVASQAADELLNVDGVAASFVLFMTGTTVNISARSFGEINVQLVMEQLGGGGHQTMAAAQLSDETLESAFSLLENAIDKIE